VRPPGLIALSPGALDAPGAARWLSAARAAFDAGLRGLVLREAQLPDRDYLAWARDVRALAPRREGGWLCVHDRAHLAEAVDADALHLGAASLLPREVRPWLATAISIGLSTHAEDPDEVWSGADYLFHGPVQRTDKPGARAPIGFDGLRRAVARAKAPVWGLGGLKPEHARELRESGAAGAAVLSGIFGAGDPAAAVRAWKLAELER
jgi:thiamine-phosphate diphosphorylase